MCVCGGALAADPPSLPSTVVQFQIISALSAATQVSEADSSSKICPLTPPPHPPAPQFRGGSSYPEPFQTVMDVISAVINLDLFHLVHADW